MIKSLVARTSLLLALLGAALFSAGGDWRWSQGWIFLAEFAISAFALGLWLARYDPSLLVERLSLPVQRNQKPWDRFFMFGVMIAFFGWLMLIALDARRFGWSHVPLWLQVVGALCFALCTFLSWETFRFNSFAVPQVRLQAERRQHVISDGPYKFVRHPMYSGALLFFVGVPLMLGSWWGLFLAPFLVAGLGIRAIGEEQMLRRELAGYDDYARHVRYRLIPGLW